MNHRFRRCCDIPTAHDTNHFGGAGDKLGRGAEEMSLARGRIGSDSGGIVIGTVSHQPDCLATLFFSTKRTLTGGLYSLRGFETRSTRDTDSNA
jgi:hypothetical protein